MNNKICNKKLIAFVLGWMIIFSGIVFSEDFILNRSSVNGFDRINMNPYSKSLDYLGTGLTITTMLTPAVMLAAPVQDYWKIGVEYAETAVISFGVNEIVKRCINRPRPYMYFEGAPQSEIEDGDCNNSFYSRHTALAFTGAGFTTFMICQYFPDSKWKIPVIAASFSLATASGVMRIASGNHFMTDVLVGAVVGTGFGFLVPWINSFWLKPSINGNIQMNASPVGLNFCIRF